MQKYSLIISIIIILLFFSCVKEKPTPSVYDLKIVKTKNILLNNNDKILSYSQKQLIKLDNNNIIILNINGKKLSFYNINNGQKVHEIITDSKKNLDSYFFVNKDSIFIFYEESHPPSDEDREIPGQFQLIDYYGNIKIKYPYNIAMSDWHNNVDMKILLPPRQSWEDIHIIQNDIFFKTMTEQIGDVGTKEFMENRLPFMMRYNTIDQKFYLSKLYNFPYIEEGIYYPTSWSVVNVAISGNNLPLVRYNYSSNVFEWDYKNDKLITHPLKSRLIDTIMPMTSPSSYHFYNLECAYGQINYDHYRKLYFANLYYNSNFYEDNDGLRTVIIANDKFEYLGELYCNKQFPIYYTKNNILSIINSNDSTIKIDYLELIKTNRDFDKYIDSCKNDLKIRKEKVEKIKNAFNNSANSLIEILKSQQNIKENNYTVLTIYPTAGCIGCNEFILNFISQQKSLLENLPFYLVITADNSKQISKELKKYNLQNFKNLAIDSIGIIKKQTQHKGLLNPRLTIIRNNKIETDDIYESFETETTLLATFLNSLGLCFADKE